MDKKPLLPPFSESGRRIATALFSTLFVAVLLFLFSTFLLPPLPPVQRLLSAAALFLAGLIALNLVRHSRAGFGLRFGVKLFAFFMTVEFWLEAELFTPRTALLLANPLPLYLAAMGLGVLLFAVAAVPWRKAHKGSLPLSLAAAITISGFLLGRSLLLAANILMDTAPFQSVTAAAAGVYEEQQGTYTHFYVTLEENSLLTQSACLPLTPEEFRTAHAGDRFVLSVHKGALGIAWAGVAPAS